MRVIVVDATWNAALESNCFCCVCCHCSLFPPYAVPGGGGGGGTLGIFGWGCAAGTLEPLSYTTKLVQVNFATLY